MLNLLQEIRKVLIDYGAHSIASINLIVHRKAVQRNPEIRIDSDLRSNFVRFLKQKDYGDLTKEIEEAGYKLIKECTEF